MLVKIIELKKTGIRKQRMDFEPTNIMQGGKHEIFNKE